MPGWTLRGSCLRAWGVVAFLTVSWWRCHRGEEPPVAQDILSTEPVTAHVVLEDGVEAVRQTKPGDLQAFNVIGQLPVLAYCKIESCP